LTPFRNKKRLTAQLEELQIHVKVKVKKPDTEFCDQKMDILEFMDLGCNGFMNGLTSTITSYNEIFIQNPVLSFEPGYTFLVDNIKSFTEELMAFYFELIKTRLSDEPFNLLEIAFFVRALDRFYRRLQNLSKVFTYHCFIKDGYKLIWESSLVQCSKALDLLKSKLTEDLTNARHSIISMSNNKVKEKLQLSESLMVLEKSMDEAVKRTIKSLNAFLSSDIAFLVDTNFRNDFILNVEQNVIFPFIKFIISTSMDYYRNHFTAIPLLVLFLSRLNLDLNISIILHLVTFLDECFYTNQDSSIKPFVLELKNSSKDCAQALIDHYVRLEGHNLSQMIKKSVETRDWFSSVEPRTVRSVMKRVVEDISLMDTQAAQLYEEGSRKDRSSDSSRTFSAIGTTSKSFQKSNWSSYGARLDENLFNEI
jgi:protein fat-free homolog